MLNFSAAILLIAFLVGARDRSPIRRRYLYFLISVSAWAGAYFFWQITKDESAADFFCRALTCFSIFISITLYHFSLGLAGVESRRSVLFGYLGACGLICLIPFGLIVAGVSGREGHLYWPDAGSLTWLYLLYFFGYLTASGWVLFRGWKRNVGSRASDQIFVLSTCLVGFLGGATNFPLWYDIPIQPYGNVLVAVYVFLLGHGLYSSRVSGVILDFYKASVGLLLSGSAALFYLLIAALYRTVVGEPMSSEEFWFRGALAFFLSIVIFWGVPRLKFWTEKILEGVFRRGRASALSELKDLPTKLSDFAEDESIFEVTADTVMRSLDVAGVAVYVLEPFDSAYRCSTSVGKLAESAHECILDVGNPLVESLSLKPACLVLDQTYGDLDQSYYRALVDLRNELNVSVIVPVFANHELYGLILVGPPKQPRVWSEEELSILFSVGAQIGINFRTRDFERRASEVDKLVALGTMAAGLAHEIRNPLVSVQTFASFVESGKSMDRIPDQFKGVLLRDVKRIASIVEGVAQYSQNQKGKKSPIYINEVLLTSIDISSKLAERHGVALRFLTEETVDAMVSANMGQLVQVFSNIFENAIQALAGVEAPEVAVSVAKRLAHSGQSWIEVAVIDNGSGIPKAILGRIFDPFITSKDTGTRDERMGMGLGLAISKRIIENHNGAISVINDPQGGAKFVVSLKCIQSKDEKTTR
ncbi:MULTISPECIES: ATP-binding protein [unclassified Lentimonas]|uniref:ATP-binding protein n=1 Tax=unclassified Lentimonas TaxID=2630993 RepID=UPI001389BDD9|nr:MULTISPECIES: ATP-binding protein [unclassified Lentimonas]